MGEGPKDLRDDAGRFDAPRNDDMVGRGDPDIVGRGTTGAEPLTPATRRVPVWVEHRQHAAPTSAVTSTARDNPNASDSTDTTAETAEIRAEIEQKRADISETIDEITQRLSPGNLVSQATDTVKETARDTMHRVSGDGNRHGAARGRHARARPRARWPIRPAASGGQRCTRCASTPGLPERCSPAWARRPGG